MTPDSGHASALFVGFGLSRASRAFWGSGITNRSSLGPRLRFVLFFVFIRYYYHLGSCLGKVVCPSRGSDPEARNGHAIANRACLPVPALGR